ncbi:MAG: hypothetical protein IKX56_05885 [Muribaculaceae bacterium]|nr:hypothetical protein [Muribaculaceae bacterium]
MNISFKQPQLKELLENGEGLKKKYGHLAKPIKKLVDKIKKLNRKELYSLPGFYELKEQAKGVYAVTIKHPHRLVMRVNPESVLILDIVDYHGKNKLINKYNLC